MKKLFLKVKQKMYLLFKKYDKVQELNSNYYRSLGMKIGVDLKCYSNINTPEAYLIELGNNITISSGVNLITHDNSICKIYKNSTDVFGKIIIHDNCFLGMNSIILPGVILGENTIVAAGSIVTKSYEEGNIIIGGNPAKVICSIEQYKEKVNNKQFNTNNMSYEVKKTYIFNNLQKLVKK